MEHIGSMEEMGEQIEREDGSSGSVSPSPSSTGSESPSSIGSYSASTIGSEEPSSPQRVHRMASTFQLGDEQPSLKPTNPTKAAANSFNNLFGPPAPAKVAPAVSSALKSGSRAQQSKVAPAGLVGEVSATKRSRKPLPINPLTGQVIGTQAARQEVQQAETTVATKRSPGGNHSQLW